MAEVESAEPLEVISEHGEGRWHGYDWDEPSQGPSQRSFKNCVCVSLSTFCEVV